jgi:hypothetical protein
MAGPNASAIVAVEILVEQQMVSPMGICLKVINATIEGAMSTVGLIFLEYTNEPLGQIISHGIQGPLLYG